MKRTLYTLKVVDPKRGLIDMGRSYHKQKIVDAAAQLERKGKRVVITEQQV